MSEAPDFINTYRLTDHARYEMSRRNIDEDMVSAVLGSPEQVEKLREGRAVYQSRFEFDDPPQTYLIRVFVDYDREVPEVVTVYRTSKIEKYWRS